MTSLPEYAAELTNFHAAFARELASLAAMVAERRSLDVLDVGCGDGFYSQLFTEQLQSGSVTGLDENEAYLQQARARIATSSGACSMRFIQKSLFDASLETERYDLVWCAQSLYSLPEPESALRRMRSLCRIGGTVAVLENDTLHQLLLPWPCDLELAIRRAEHADFAARSSEPDKYYIGRRLPSALAEAGLEPQLFRTQAIDRRAPLSEAERTFLLRHLVRLKSRVAPRLDAGMRERFDELVLPGGPRFLLDDLHFTFTWINVVATGKRSI